LVLHPGSIAPIFKRVAQWIGMPERFDGGETVRQAQGESREFGEPILDWLHVAMRVTQLSQAIKGLAADTSSEEDSAVHIDE